ncbi:vacuolar protein sorting-associated protein vps13 [Rhizophagus clarus]|uniref:Vacuolar protein sorting-associated protein n=1 Tax=Rhizophagus clarus TaxID=94130 RepID=A0A8H3QSI5_9GLOM|nr:vacuolar protein sorting-associated protein vps13 [Rhizophagus clarus]
MLESLVANVLNRFLGAYVANLEVNQLNIAIWTGDVVLRNLQLKKEALDKFNLPIDVLEGYLGELTLNIPWSNLKNKPVKVFINNVYLLAVPKAESEYDPQEDENRAQQLKQEKLANADLLNSQLSESTEDDQKNQSFVNQLVTKVVDNLQISINNIHIRYEDKLSDPGHPFAVGLTLSEFSAVSTDGNWKPTFIEGETSTIHKLITLGSLAVYWNTDSRSLAGHQTNEAVKIFNSLIESEKNIPSEHQYILKPVSGTGRIILNKQFDVNNPKTIVTLLFDELGFVLDDEQYRDALLMVDLFHFYIRQQQYRKFRPPKDVTPKKDPKAWLQFAGGCILSEIRERNKKFTWAYFAERRDDRHSYVKLYKDKQLDKITPEDQNALNSLERKLSYEDIRFYRSIAKSQLRKEKALIAKKQQENASQQSQRGWLSGWWWGGSQSDAGEGDSILTDEQRKELYQAIDYDESTAVQTAVDFPKEWIKLSLKTKLKTGSFTLKKDPHGKKTNILSVKFDTVTANFIQRPESFQAESALGSLTVFDGSTEGTLYPQIVRVKDYSTEASQKDLTRNNRASDIGYDESQDPFFQLVFEQNPLDGRADNGVSMKMRHLEIIYNVNAVEAVMDFFRPPDQRLESISALIEAAGDTLEGIKAQTRAGLEYALEEHKTIDVKIDMNAPIFIVPESCIRSDAQAIVLDSGHISVESKLVSKQQIAEIQSKASKNYSEKDYEKLESLMYDRFTVELSSTQLLVGQSVERCLAQIRDSEANYGLHVIDRINMQFNVEMSIIRHASNLTKFRVTGQLPLLKANFSDRKYKIIMNIIEKITPKSTNENTSTDSIQFPSEKFSFNDIVEDVLKERQKGKKPVLSKNMANKALAWKQKDTIAEKLGLKTSQDLVIDSASEGEENDESHEDKPEEFFDAQDTDDSNNAKVNQRIFEFVFRVDKFTATLKKADPDPHKPEVVLVDMVLEHFGLNYVLRPFDMSAEVVLKSLSIEDKISVNASEFKHIASSEGYGNAQSEDSKDLVHIKYFKVNSKSPEYMSKFEGIDQGVDIELSTINVIISRESILTLYSFMLDTFTAPPTSTSTPTSQTETVDVQSGTESEEIRTPQSKPSTIRVKAKLNSIRFILNNDGVRLATGLLSLADVAVHLRQNTIRVGARLGNFSLSDDTAGEDRPESLRQLLTMQGEDLAVFKYETFDEKMPGFPGYNSSVYLRTGSARLTFLEEPIRLLLEFGSKFAQMKGLYDSARNAAVQQATQLQESVSKFHFDIVVRAPIILFTNDVKSKDSVIANFGVFSASNKFISNETGKGELTQIKAELQKIRVTSEFVFPDGMKQVLQIIDDVDINFKISYSEHIKGSVRPDMEIVGEMSDVKMSLTEKQYKYLFDLSNTIPQAFSTVESTNENTSNSLTSPSQYPKNSSASGTSPSQKDEEVVEPWTTIDLKFDVNQIYLEIFSGDGSQTKSLSDTSLSKFCLNKTKVKYKMLSDRSMEAELSLQSATLNDTRTNVQNVYREILPAVNKETAQFSVNVSISGGTERNIVAIVTVDSPRIILTLDHLFATRNYFMSAFGSSNSNTNQATSQSQQESRSIKSSQSNVPSLPPRPTTAQPQVTTSLNYRVNVTYAEIILLANPHLANTEAIVLSANQIVVTQQQVLALTVEKIGMFLCRMDKRADSLIRFIDNFNFAMTMDTRTSRPGQQLTNINVDIGPLVLRLSYRDVLLITTIVNKVSELSSQSSAQPPEKETKPKLEIDSNVPLDNSLSKNFNYDSLTAAKKGGNSKKSPSVLQTLMMTRETLKATFHGTRLVVIGDEHNIPMIDASANQFSVDVSDWSSQMSVDATVSTYINYFNLTNSHWEPLVEPWQYSLHASKNLNPESMVIDISSQRRLEINISHIFLETIFTTLSIVNHESEHVLSTSRGSRTPYKLRNRTGYNMHVWSISSDDAIDTEIKKMDDEQDLNWRFDDWRKTRETISFTKNMLGVQFEGAIWECIKEIPVDREAETMYMLRPKVNKISHRLVVDIKLKDNIKVVTFRSSFVIENRTLLTIEMLVVDEHGKNIGKVYQIAPGEDCPVPIEHAYHNRLKIRPEGGFGYNWSVENLYWQDFIKRNPIKAITCESIENEVPFRFQVFARYKKNDPLVKEYPCMAIRLSAPLEVENLLPYDFTFRIVDKTTNQNYPDNYLRKGAVTALHVIELDHLLLLNVDVQDSGYKASEFSIISSPNSDYPVDNTLTLTDSEGLKLTLRIHYTEIPDSGGAFKFSIYSPYVMINKTGLDMVFKSKSLLASAKIAAGQGSLSKKKTTVAPYMFSYPSDELRNRALLKVGDSDWSEPLSFEAVGTFMEISIPSATKSEEIHLGVSIQGGHQKYKLTKIVTFTPRFILKNNLNEDINFREPESSNAITIKSKDRAPLHFLRKGNVKQLMLSYPGLNKSWSAPFNIDEIGRVHVQVGKSDEVTDLIRTEILIEDATVFVILNKEEGKWPYRIENYSDVDVDFYQQDPNRRDFFGTSTSQSNISNVKKYHLPSGNATRYSWDFPAQKEKRLVLNVKNVERVVNIQEIGSLMPFKYPTDGGHRIIAIEVAADGPTQVLLLSNYNQSQSIFRPKAPSISSVSKDDSNTAGREAFEVIDVDSVTTLSFQIRLEGIGISVINKRMQELAYASMRGLEFKYNDSTLYQSVTFLIKWLQIDNQLYGGLYPIILYPTVIPKDAKETDAHPAFHASLIKAKDESHGVIYFKYFSLLLQEMTFEIDEDFLFALLEFTKFAGSSNNDEKEGQLINGTLDIPEPKSTEGDNQWYFEVLHIHPMKINISFVRTERINVENKPPPRNPIMFFFNVLTMAIGNINDAPIKLNALAMENARVSLPVLINRINRHYGEAFIYQVHKIIGSADFLGNPVGLFNNISSGVVDIFYEPYQGFVLNRPQDLGIGLARGATSFFKKTVYGFSDSFSKVTGSIGKGLSAATLDKTYQDRRRMAQFRNRPKHALYGVTQGVNSLASSITSGFEGVVRKPIEGVEKEGAAGLLKGVGKGLVGFVTKPVVGVFDFASNVTEGIRNTTTVFDENDIAPVRLPRYVGRDGILKPYDQREALGQSWLKGLEDGKYFNEEYTAHLDLQKDERVVILTRSRIMLVKSKKLKVEWEVLFSDLQTISLQPQGILLNLKKNTPGPFIPIPDPESKNWFERKIEMNEIFKVYI